ncbi:Ig-like domain-containing protein, partial [Tenacibaculum finnmarkense]|uniref:Ig-like domain-containing protein n=1 Tax=Tenacibaculum finnmarkense TaxID=2781243 RepID=UPI001EFB0E00
GAPSGTYEVTYEICENGANPANCKSNTATVLVENPLVANIDDFTGTPLTIGDPSPSVIADDTLDGAAVVIGTNPGQVTLSGTTVPSEVTLNADGTITVNAGAPSGTYEVTYEICENGANPANCKSNTATVLVENPLVANIDDFTGTPLTIGDSSPSVIADDTLDGAAVVIGTSPGQVTLSGTTVPSEVTLNADGTITVNAGAPSGTYEVTYEICENGANPANCKSNTATVLVENLLLADNDTLGTALVPLASGVNPVAAGSVLTGDTLNGVQVTTVNTDITPVTSGNILIDADGNVTIAANTPTGFYPVIYTICENVANPANCTEATVTVEVVGELVAVADKFTSINGKDRATTVSVLENDTLNGEKVIPSEITLTVGTAPTPIIGSILMNTDGTITIAPGTTAGTYDYEYTICENLNPANCSTVISEVIVEAAPIEAVKAEFTSINGKDGATTTSVLENDTLNGKEIVPSEVTLTVGTAPTPIAGSITMNADGNIIVAPGTTAGTYDYEYTICENLNPANCSTVTSKVVVEAAPIEAVKDEFTSINGKDGATTTSVLENDTLNGKEIVPSEVTLTVGTAPTPIAGSILMNTDGTITIAPGTTAGTYDYEYTICENLNPANCSTVTSKVVVEAAPIKAVKDEFTSINGKDGATTTSVLENDTLNGKEIVPSEVTLTVGTAPTPIAGSILMNTDGTITIAPGTTAGTYDYEYTICENLNPANCKTVTSTVEVVAAPIEAVADTFTSINGKEGNITTSVLENDKLNGKEIVPSEITLTAGTAPTPTSGSITMNADGNIIVAPGTTAGTYDYEYTICEKLNPSNCSTVISKVIVEAAPIEAVKDEFTSINGKEGNITASVLENDTLNGVKVVPSEITLTAGTAPTPTSGSITMNADGSITIAPGTTAGTYDYEYTICENLNPANCKTVTSKVVVEAAPIEAVADTFTSINGKEGNITTSVLENDTLNGVKVVPSEITLTAGTAPTPTSGSITMNADGNIIVAPGTTAGTYDYEYTICENLNPANCKTVTSTVEVVAAPIEAVADTFTLINGKDGATTTSVLENDKLNGKEIVPSEITLTVVNIAGGLTLNDDGTVTVPPNTPAGTYQVEYSICEKLNPTNCSAVISEVVVIRAPTATNDSSTGNTPGDDATIDVLDNDKLSDGSSITDPATQVTIDLDPTTVGVQNTLVVPNEGTWTVDPATGILTFSPEDGFTQTPTDVVYTLTEISTGLTDTATVKVEYTEVDTAVTEIDTPVVVDIFENDSDIPTSGTISTTTPTNGTVEVTDPNNTPNDPSDDVVTYVPDTDFSGTDTFEYTVCDNASTPNCQTATVTIKIGDIIKDDPAATEIDTPVVVDIFENDSDIPTSGTISTTTPTNGTVEITDPNNTPNDPSDDVVTYVPDTDFSGTDTFEYTVCDNASTPNCQTATVTIVVVPEANPCGTPYNIMTPDNDGENDSFFISCIDKPEYANNTVEIFNRWGNTVYKASGYNNESVSFKGISNGRTTLVVDEKLPAGTYYYVIDLGDGSKAKAGWLYINR